MEILRWQILTHMYRQGPTFKKSTITNLTIEKAFNFKISNMASELKQITRVFIN